jgi:hypothetical protein
MELQMRMLEDPVIRRRLLADTAARRLVTEMVPELPAEQRARMERILRDTAVAGAAGARVRRPAAKSPAKPARSRRPAARPTDPHSGHPAPAPAKRDSTPTDDHSHHPPSP